MNENYEEVFIDLDGEDDNSENEKITVGSMMLFFLIRFAFYGGEALFCFQLIIGIGSLLLPIENYFELGYLTAGAAYTFLGSWFDYIFGTDFSFLKLFHKFGYYREKFLNFCVRRSRIYSILYSLCNCSPPDKRYVFLLAKVIWKYQYFQRWLPGREKNVLRISSMVEYFERRNISNDLVKAYLNSLKLL